MLLDDVLPTFDFREVHTIVVNAAPQRVYAALKQVTPAETPLFQFLFALRGLPLGSAARRGRGLDVHLPIYDQFVGGGFTLLADEPDQELLIGRIGQFWKLSGGTAIPIRDRAEFKAFEQLGYAKAALNFFLRGQDDGTRLSTETRIRATDATSRRAFARYWLLIRLGSGTIRASWLRAIRRRAEK